MFRGATVRQAAAETGRFGKQESGATTLEPLSGPTRLAIVCERELARLSNAMECCDNPLEMSSLRGEYYSIRRLLAYARSRAGFQRDRERRGALILPARK